MIGLYGPRNTVRKHLDPMLTPQACPRAGRAHSHPFFGGGGRLRRMGSRQSTKIDQNRPKSKIVDFRKSSIFEKHDFWFSSVSDCERACVWVYEWVRPRPGGRGRGWEGWEGWEGVGGAGGAPQNRKSSKSKKHDFRKSSIFRKKSKKSKKSKCEFRRLRLDTHQDHAPRGPRDSNEHP